MSVSAAVSSFVTDLYRRSDVGPEGHEAYIDLYLPDATLVMGPATYEGHDGVRKFREGGWEKVATRKHICEGIFAGKNADEVMTYGTVDYGFKDGSRKDGIEWAARLVMDQSSGQPKIKFYQVYIVSSDAARRVGTLPC
jgi:hypothetical protein